MNKKDLIDMYVKEILKANSDVEKLERVLDVVIGNTERSLLNKVSSDIYDLVPNVRTLRAWS